MSLLLIHREKERPIKEKLQKYAEPPSVKTKGTLTLMHNHQFSLTECSDKEPLYIGLVGMGHDMCTTYREIIQYLDHEFRDQGLNDEYRLVFVAGEALIHVVNQGEVIQGVINAFKPRNFEYPMNTSSEGNLLRQLDRAGIPLYKAYYAMRGLRIYETRWTHSDQFFTGIAETSSRAVEDLFDICCGVIADEEVFLDEVPIGSINYKPSLSGIHISERGREVFEQHRLFLLNTIYNVPPKR